MSLLESYQCSEKYWNPDFSKVNEEQVEYLFQGKIKVIEKVF